MFWSIFLNSLALIAIILVVGTILSVVLKGRTPNVIPTNTNETGGE